jgi:hypothetical protein
VARALELHRESCGVPCDRLATLLATAMASAVPVHTAAALEALVDSVSRPPVQLCHSRRLAPWKVLQLLRRHTHTHRSALHAAWCCA